MLRLVKLLPMLLGVLLLGACAAPASRDAMDIPSTERTQYITAHFLTGKVTVGSVIGGQETNPAWTSEIDNVEFEAALRSSLETAYLLSPVSKAEYELSAELIDIDQPVFGFTFTVTSKIHYLLREIASQQTVMDKVVTAEGTATTGDAFAGVKRLKLANERSAQENIQEIIDDLYNYEKP